MADQWRAELRAYLTAHIGKPVEIGEVVRVVGDMIPLHTATRLGRRKQDRAASVRVMRRNTIINLLSHYSVVWPGERRKGLRLSDRAVLVPQAQSCVLCGAVFCGLMDQRSCSRRCGSTWGKRQVAAQVEALA